VEKLDHHLLALHTCYIIFLVPFWSGYKTLLKTLFIFPKPVSKSSDIFQMWHSKPNKQSELYVQLSPPRMSIWYWYWHKITTSRTLKHNETRILSNKNKTLHPNNKVSDSTTDITPPSPPTREELLWLADDSKMHSGDNEVVLLVWEAGDYPWITKAPRPLMTDPPVSLTPSRAPARQREVHTWKWLSLKCTLIYKIDFLPTLTWRPYNFSTILLSVGTY
jgi:hypothetical protein